MSQAFRKILIPVDFSINTDVAIEKAIEVAENGATLHLLHMQYYGYPGLSPSAYRFILPNEKKDFEQARQNLEKLKTSVESSYSGVYISYGIDNRSSVEGGIEKAVRKMDPGLIMIGMKSPYSRLSFMKRINPVRLSRRVQKPVMVVRPGASRNKLKKIIVPVDARMDPQKLEIIQAICRNAPVKVYLLSFENEQAQSSELYKQMLLKCYESLKAGDGHQLENAVIDGKNRADSIFRFTEKVGGDLVVINAEKPPGISWPRIRIFDAINNSSKVQVLLVN